MEYDCVVVGVGGMGSAALWAAARRGWRVIGLEQFGAAHDRGSSHGRTRMIRTAYYEHPNYVPLARRSWDRWHQMQSQGSVALIRETGLLQVGNPDGELIAGVRESAGQHDIAIQEWTPDEAMQRFPALNITAGAACIFEQTAGLLHVENCVAQMIQLAKQCGAELLTDCCVDHWSWQSDGRILVSLNINSESIRTRRLILCPGAWASQFPESFPVKIQVLRKQQHWFQLDRHDIKLENGFPGFLIENENGCFYGFPEIDYLGLKVAEHSGGSLVDDPDSLDRGCDPAELARVEQFLDNSFRFTRRRLVHHSACLYSMSPDSHFVVDLHPQSPQIAMAIGFSGHGFKFAPVIGERLVGLLESEPDDMLEFLRIDGRCLES